MLPPFFSHIGSDRYLTAAEVASVIDARAPFASTWDLYTTHFQRFTGASLDPQFHRLAQPAVQTGRVCLDPDSAVVVVGTGPSLHKSLGRLQAAREHLRIFTSPQGADVLLRHGIVPDLVLVEHQTALDAHHSARSMGDCDDPAVAACPLVAADWRTPRTLLAGVSADALFVPTPMPTWGLWPATAAAMAADAGAARVGLLGLDLGTATAPEAVHAPLRALLEEVSRLAGVVTLDCDTGGAHKPGWALCALDHIGGSVSRGALGRDFGASPGVQARLDRAHAELHELEAVIRRARRLLEWATEARSFGRGVAMTMLDAAVGEVMAWRHEPRVRVLLQECLGLSFLPRFWRIGIDSALGPALWRPLLLATHELTAQADALARAVAIERAA